ncbi:MAG: tetratricopeptide repeat protein [Chthoniobacterales bacterium]|nr:tetratricopeptide repeat protein [Chthoniobacterales bacterium]
MGDAEGNPKQLSTADMEALVREQPNDPVALMRLGDSYETQGEFPKAAGAYERAYKANPKLVSAAVKLAQLNGGPLKNKEKAFDYAKKARELAPTDPKAAARLGSIAYQTGNFPWAYSLLQESARQIGDDPVILHDLAWAAYSQGNVLEARMTMERILKLPSMPREIEDAKTFLTLTALEGAGKDLISAEGEINKTLSVSAGYVPALMAKAAIQMRRGDTNAAEAIYSDVLKQFPDFAPAQKYLAAIYSEDPSTTGKASELATKARKTLAADPELTRIFGVIAYQKKEFSRAIQLFEESGRITPLEAKSLYFLGMSHLAAAHESEGLDLLSRAVAEGLPPQLAQKAKEALKGFHAE